MGWKLLIPDLPAQLGLKPPVPDTQLEGVGAEPLPPSVPLPAVADPPEPFPALPQGANKRIMFVTGSDYPPFTGEDLSEQGMLTEVVRTVFESMGYNVGFEFWGWKHGFNAAQEGRFTGTFPHFINREHLPHFFYSKPLFRVMIRGFVHREKPFRFDQIEDFGGRVICRPDGHDLYDLQPLLVNERIKLKSPKTIETCFKLLMQGKVDVVSVSEFAGQGVLHEADLTERVCMLDNVVSIDTVHLLFPKRVSQSGMLMKQFDQALTRLETAGTLDAIRSRHLKQYYDRFGVPPAYFLAMRSPIRR